MRIAFLTNNYLPFTGGVPISIKRLGDGLRELGHTVYIFAPDYGDNGQDTAYTIRYQTFKRRIHNMMPLPTHILRDLQPKFQALDFDLIHVHHPAVIGAAALHLGRKYHIPVAFTYHTQYEQYLHYASFLNPLFRRAQREKGLAQAAVKALQYCISPGYLNSFMKRCDMVFAPTESIRAQLLCHDPGVPIRVLPTGLPESIFEKSGSAAGIRAKYLGGKQYLLCTVSRLAKEKNFPFMLQGLAYAKERLGDIFKLMVLGDGPEKEALISCAADLGLEGNVLFLGNIPNREISGYHQASDLFLFCSLTETQGIVLLEAMAASLPVLAVRASGVSDVLEHNWNGLMSGNSVEEWGDKLCRLLKDGKLLMAFKKPAIETALQYRESIVAQMAAGHYGEMLQNQGVRRLGKNFVGWRSGQ